MSNDIQTNRCRACGSKQLNRFLDLGKQPLANSFLDSPKVNAKSYELALCFCESCSLVQLTADVPRTDMFSQYLWQTGTSKGANHHLERLADELLGYACKFAEEITVIEAASNDGTALSKFANRGCSVLGVDPAENLAAEANKQGLTTICDYFSSKSAEKVVRQAGKGDIVICRNVLAHVPDIGDFVEGLGKVLVDDGVLYIEFHYAGSIKQGLQYDSIYHEHASYISLTALAPLFEKNGLQLFAAKIGPISGGCLQLYLSKKSNPKRVVEDSVVNIWKFEREEMLGSFVTWQSFAKKVEDHRTKFVALLEKTRANGKNVCGFGASARSSTLLNYCNISTNEISLIADNNELKHSLYTAGTNIQIRSPKEVFALGQDVVVLLAWNFKDEIVEEIKYFGFKGEVVLPLPINPSIISI